jgi:hypothetical protein
MGFIEKLKLLFRARQPLTDLIVEVKQAKAGWKTLVFWVSVTATLGGLVAALQGIIPPSAELIGTTVIAAFYNILRGATKANNPEIKPLFQTSEFYLSVLTEISNAFVALKAGGINPTWMATALSVVGAAMAAGQNIAGQAPSK